MNMNYIILGILIPFIGTSLGSACVYFLKGKKTPGENAPVINPNLQKGLTGFAAGVMVAASIWSLLIPAMEESGRAGCGRAYASFCTGIFSSYALFPLLCGRCDDLCGCRRVDSGNRGRRALKLGSAALCRRIYRHDGTGCSSGVVISILRQRE